ncbi:MAG: hypothetical protein AMS19_10835 [Gemmatimonas sp. SG8_23]|nr:MAG: hypothetical protein AMS19_10835 [Gemmatimonas sp. SG8_23]
MRPRRQIRVRRVGRVVDPETADPQQAHAERNSVTYGSSETERRNRHEFALALRAPREATEGARDGPVGLEHLEAERDARPVLAQDARGVEIEAPQQIVVRGHARTAHGGVHRPDAVQEVPVRRPDRTCREKEEHERQCIPHVPSH